MIHKRKMQNRIRIWVQKRMHLFLFKFVRIVSKDESAHNRILSISQYYQGYWLVHYQGYWRAPSDKIRPRTTLLSLIHETNFRYISVFNVMSILLVILVKLIAYIYIYIYNTLRNYVTENVLVSIHLLSSAHVLILEAQLLTDIKR